MKHCLLCFFYFSFIASASAEDWHFRYFDSFNKAKNDDYGLNDNLPERQYYGLWEGTTWDRRDGTWYDKIDNPSWLSQVNHVNTPDRLSFHLEPSSVMLNHRISSGSANRYKIKFKTDPVKNDKTSGMWTSFMLDSDSTKRGYVTQTNFGFLIRSNGAVGVFQNGHSKRVSNRIPPADTYDIVLDIKPGLLKAVINGYTVTAVLDEPIPESAHPYLGAYIDKNTGAVSWFDDFTVNIQRGSGPGHLKYYGYYWTESPEYGSHLNEVVDYTNFNFITIPTHKIESLGSQYFVDRCKPKKCILQVRWEFWPWDLEGHENLGKLSPNWLSTWASIKNTIIKNQNLLAALYIVDEPFLVVKVNPQDYEMILSQVKQDLPNLPIMATFAHSTVSKSMPYVNGLNWVAANKYVPSANFSTIERMQEDLQARQPYKPIFVIPQSHFEGTTSDADVARINWRYYDWAINNDNTIGILNFGLWTHIQPESIPITRAAQKLMGEAVTKD